MLEGILMLAKKLSLELKELEKRLNNSTSRLGFGCDMGQGYLLV